MRIRHALVRGDNGEGCIDKAWLLGTMAGVILFRHLPRHARAQVNRRVNSLLSPRRSGLSTMLYRELHNRILNILVTPDWGVWSMSNSELQKALKSDAQLRHWLDLIGGTSKFGGTLAGVWTIIAKSPKGVPATIIGFIIHGANTVLKAETEFADAKYRQELSRRQIMLSSKYYR